MTQYSSPLIIKLTKRTRIQRSTMKYFGADWPTTIKEIEKNKKKHLQWS
jgi:hypothetical protein